MADANSNTIVDLTGMRFHRLLVLKKSDKTSTSGAMWDCVCDCGNVRTVASLKLRSGKTKSCGCYRPVSSSEKAKTHGMSNSGPTYKTWKEMRQRCLNRNSDKWKWYGGRGIEIDKSWDDFSVFLRDMGERPYGKTLDRIDPDGNYTKSNCRWATPKQQAETNRGCFKKGNVPWDAGIKWSRKTGRVQFKQP